MKYIDSTEIQEKLPDGWEEKAKEAYETVLALSPEERSGAINRFSHLWTQLKDVLQSHFHGKCWYCEAIQERSDNAVDHFRPKNKVFECPKHGGYWWLAFKWLNYRYSCTFCNSRRINKDGVSGESMIIFRWKMSRRGPIHLKMNSTRSNPCCSILRIQQILAYCGSMRMDRLFQIRSFAQTTTRIFLDVVILLSPSTT